MNSRRRSLQERCGENIHREWYDRKLMVHDLVSMKCEKLCDRRTPSSWRLFLNLQEFDVEDKLAVGWDTWK